jgi:hypothetical protein
VIDERAQTEGAQVVTIDMLGLTIGVIYCLQGYGLYPRYRFWGSAMILCGVIMGIGGFSELLRGARAFQYLFAASIVAMIVTALASGIAGLRRYWRHRQGEADRLARLSVSESQGDRKCGNDGKRGS